jgi:hypothetical protein
MFERFDAEARAVVVHAQQHARRLGHHYIGGEHLLLAVASGDHPASAVLSAHGITPQYVEEEIVRRVGLGAEAVPEAGTGLFGSLDRDALASIGIDLDTVRARLEASFGSRALLRADEAARRREKGPGGARGKTRTRRSWTDHRRALSRSLMPRWHRRRTRSPFSQRVITPSPAQEPGPAPATGRYRADHPTTGHIPFTPVAKGILELTVREMVKLHDSTIGAEHIALALTAVKRGLVPPILAAAGASAPGLHGEIVDRYRQAS